jgi:hydroxyethylthiazole kinase
MTDAAAIADALARLRAAAPLVQSITNYVVMNSTANALLAIGASPAMVHAAEEVEEFVAISSALVINIGTLSPPWVAAMRPAALRANALAKPWVLDPVGAGATRYRTAVAADLLALKPTVLRANASEVLATAGDAARTRGVDSADDSDAALPAAKRTAQAFGLTVAVTGPTDYVTDGSRVRAIHNGHALMPRVTGLGCTASALVGAFLAVEPDPVLAATYALAVLGLCGELAAAKSAGPGTLQLHLYDALHALDRAMLDRHLRLD